MKRLILICLSLLVVSTSFSQDFEKGGSYITVGYVADPFGHAVLGHGGTATYEYGVTDVLGIGRIGAGGGVSTLFYRNHWNGVYGGVYDNRMRISLSARATYHFEFNVPKMDVYAGFGGALHFDTDEEKYYLFNGVQVVDKRSHVRGGHYVFAGIRYYFTSAFGVYAEVGHGHRAFNGGIVFAL